ncbi:MAG: hypothetical protein IH964_12845 [Candidatus Dadabacteria bacterium]|nr:hypothetical protein [Candidatus Dadabacteria bacterium]
MSVTIGVAVPVVASIEYNTPRSSLERPTNPSGKGCALPENEKESEIRIVTRKVKKQAIIRFLLINVTSSFKRFLQLYHKMGQIINREIYKTK